MNNLKTKGILAAIIMLIILFVSTSIFAAGEEMQVVKKSEKEYMIYIKDNLTKAFEFAFSNDKNAKKEDLVFHKSALDMEDKNANNIAYVDEEIYGAYFSKDTYIWARTDEANYILEGKLLSLETAITEENIQTANNLTKGIKVDTTQSSEKTTENAEGVKETKIVGKIIVKEEGKNSYQLVKIAESGDVAEFAKVVEEIVKGKIESDYYSKLESASELLTLYNKLLPSSSDKNWVEASDNEILQPEDAKEDEKFIVWIKNESGGTVKFDVQFLTCFEEEQPEAVSEKIISKLPVTGDDPTLFIILGVLIIAFVIILVARAVASKKEKN